MVVPACYSAFWMKAYKNNKNILPAVGMSREAYGESGDRVVTQEVK